MTKYKKTKQQRKLEKNNLIKAYASLNERGCISNAEFKKSIAEINTDYKSEGV